MAAEGLRIDPSHSQVSFSVRKLGVLKVKGVLADFSGKIRFNDDDLYSSSFEVSVSTTSIDTGNPKRDEHLKSEDFFAVAEPSRISYRSGFVYRKNGQYMTVGELTFRGSSKLVAIPFSFNDGVFTGQFTLDRFDYELGRRFPAFFVGRTIKISINCKVDT